MPVPEPEAVLGVGTSLLGRNWALRCTDERSAEALSQGLGLPDVVGRILAGRGVDREAAERFLSPSLKAELPDPSVLKDMDVAAARIADVVMAGGTVGVFGDYDVDGATSAALLSRFLHAAGGRCLVHIPDRMRDGYGPNAPALKAMAGQGADVIVTVDCGITAFDALGQAAAAGIPVIVVDHHQAEPRLPEAAAVVNPNRLDEPAGPLQALAAVGVTYLLVIAVNRLLRTRGWYGEGRPEPSLLSWLDMVALGTIADVVPLTGLNRVLAAQGLRVMAGRRNTGLSALADVSRLHEPPGAYHAGFLLGPRINAGGRVGESDLGVRLLTCDDPAEASALASRLDAFNAERQQIEAAVLEQAAAAHACLAEPDAPVCLVAAEGWHPGVLGIVASRLREQTDRPTVVIGLDGGMGKGSGRSVPGVDLGAAVIAARQKGLLVNGGGHKMAAGLTVEAGRIDELRAFLCERLHGPVAAAAAVRRLGIDAVLSPGAANEGLLDLLERVAPFGVGNPEPRFALANADITFFQVVGERHVRCTLQGPTGGRVKAIAFRAVDTPLGAALMQRDARLHLAGHLRADHWRGERRVQFVIEDGARPVAL
ncbi:single-stranded-DNA-specific exonuclease RecJ [Marinibaculum pumilum]|uniref:Single-stranded-DNA-specific exonuclease RecJ n=1 Tax=Marinibaculum pumilum TaxID=1766165 RepID=A0ABV7KUS9_9PROT